MSSYFASVAECYPVCLRQDTYSLERYVARSISDVPVDGVPSLPDDVLQRVTVARADRHQTSLDVDVVREVTRHVEGPPVREKPLPPVFSPTPSPATDGCEGVCRRHPIDAVQRAARAAVERRVKTSNEAESCHMHAKCAGTVAM
eukprot:PhM_4_TR14730/c0_g1_i1/m.66498